MNNLMEFAENIIARFKEPICMGTKFVNEQMICDDPEAPPLNGWIGSLLPANGEQMMNGKEQFCNAMATLRDFLNCPEW